MCYLHRRVGFTVTLPCMPVFLFVMSPLSYPLFLLFPHALLCLLWQPLFLFSIWEKACNTLCLDWNPPLYRPHLPTHSALVCRGGLGWFCNWTLVNKIAMWAFLLTRSLHLSTPWRHRAMQMFFVYINIILMVEKFSSPNKIINKEIKLTYNISRNNNFIHLGCLTLWLLEGKPHTGPKCIDVCKCHD